jgi:hypothetical protein
MRGRLVWAVFDIEAHGEEDRAVDVVNSLWMGSKHMERRATQTPGNSRSRFGGTALSGYIIVVESRRGITLQGLSGALPAKTVQ